MNDPRWAKNYSYCPLTGTGKKLKDIIKSQKMKFSY